MFDTARCGVASKCTNNTAGIHPVVFKEPGVLDRHDGLAHHWGDALEWNFNAVLVVQRCQQRAVGSQDDRTLGQRRGAQRRRQGFELGHHIARDHARRTRERHQHQTDDHPGQD